MQVIKVVNHITIMVVSRWSLSCVAVLGRMVACALLLCCAGCEEEEEGREQCESEAAG
jgi:hypothetical protein